MKTTFRINHKQGEKLLGNENKIVTKTLALLFTMKKQIKLNRNKFIFILKQHSNNKSSKNPIAYK